MSKESEAAEYFADLKEAQEKQYLPGYFVGGKLPFAVKYSSPRLGWVFLILAFPAVAIALVGMLTSGVPLTVLSSGALLPVLALIVYLIIGIKLITKKRPPRH